ncbi:hypothetical protein E4T42_07859 [Aureobasidium subglaciale]|nr:hypothetical protein E4T42_07859 [Aureobasidium subglaciale]
MAHSTQQRDSTMLLDEALYQEIAMMGVMNHLMVKPNWHKKVFNTTIATKWEQEARALPNFSKRMWRYCLAELRDKADEFNASVVSYINNFHPVTHIDLYHIIEKLITAYLPLWNQFLKNTESGLDKSRIDINDFGWHMPYGENSPENWVDDHNADNEAVLERLALEVRSQQTLIVDEEEIIEDSVAGWQRRESKDHHLEVRLPFDLMRDHKQIQVIVKLASIHLSPDNPNYSGGSCHVEGSLNEHIVATALFYYDQVNIGPSHLAFRQNVETESDSSFSNIRGGQDIRGLRDLPDELINQIIEEDADFPMSLEEAKNIRQELMQERSRNTPEIINSRAAHKFNFCEH